MQGRIDSRRNKEELEGLCQAIRESGLQHFIQSEDVTWAKQKMNFAV